MSFASKLNESLHDVVASGDLEDDRLHGGVTVFGDDNGRFGLVFGPSWSASGFL